MTGRPPKSSADKALRGNPGKRPFNPNEPKPPPGAVTCPNHLDAGAKTEWRRVAPKLMAMGVLTVIDRALLAKYCQLYSRWKAAEVMIANEGMVVKTARGGIQKSPYVDIAHQSMMLCLRTEAELGLTPSSRSRIQVKPPKTDTDGQEVTTLTLAEYTAKKNKTA